MDPLSTYRDGIYGIEMLREACKKGYITKYEEDYYHSSNNGFTLIDGSLARIRHLLNSTQIAECLYEYGIYCRVRLDRIHYKVNEINLIALTICLFCDSDLEECIKLNYKCFEIVFDVQINLSYRDDLLDKIYVILYYDQAKKVVLLDGRINHDYDELIKDHPVNQYLKAKRTLADTCMEFEFTSD